MKKVPVMAGRVNSNQKYNQRFNTRSSIERTNDWDGYHDDWADDDADDAITNMPSSERNRRNDFHPNNPGYGYRDERKRHGGYDDMDYENIEDAQYYGDGIRNEFSYDLDQDNRDSYYSTPDDYRDSRDENRRGGSDARSHRQEHHRKIKPACASPAIIPFSSEPCNVHTGERGESRTVSPIGFGASTGAIEINCDKSITASGNRQIVLSLPYNAIISSIYMTVGNHSTFSKGVLYPYIQLYYAPAGSNVFKPLDGGCAYPVSGIPAQSPENTMVAGHSSGLNLRVPAGTRLLIGGKAEMDGTPTEWAHVLYFTGSVAVSMA